MARLAALLLGVLATTALGLILCLAVGTVGARVAGANMVVITGRSMEPEIPIGSLALVRPLDPASDLVGEPVAFLTPGGHLITHRVTRVATLDGVDYVETKGDANDTPDPVLTPASAIVGSVAFTVPVAGFVEAVAGRPVGVMTLLALVIAARAARALVRREGAR